MALQVSYETAQNFDAAFDDFSAWVEETDSKLETLAMETSSEENKKNQKTSQELLQQYKIMRAEIEKYQTTANSISETGYVEAKSNLKRSGLLIIRFGR